MCELIEAHHSVVLSRRFSFPLSKNTSSILSKVVVVAIRRRCEVLHSRVVFHVSLVYVVFGGMEEDMVVVARTLP